MILEYVYAASSLLLPMELPRDEPEVGWDVEVQGDDRKPTLDGSIIGVANDRPDGAKILFVEVDEKQVGAEDLMAWVKANGDFGIRRKADEPD